MPLWRLLLFALALLAAGGQAAEAVNARRQLEVQNHTAEPVRVFVAYHSVTPSGQWVWGNADMDRSWVLQPGERTTLNDHGFTINADLIRIRAEALNSGRKWDWGELFIGSAARGPSRVVGKTLFTIWAEDGLPLFSDRHTRRQIAVKNDTGETLHICVAYHTRLSDGKWGWKNTDCNVHWTFEPGQHSYLAIDDVRINANAIKISARNEAGDRVWTEHRDEALFVGDYEGTGGVEGSKSYTFTQANARGFQPLLLKSVKLEPSKVKAGLSLEVAMEYTVGGLAGGLEHKVREEQLIEKEGAVIRRFSESIGRRPGTYLSKRKVNIPIVAEPGRYTITCSVSTGRRVKGFLGVHVKSVTPELAQEQGLDGREGAYVVKVLDGSPADASGLEPGDLIMAFDGQAVASHTELLSLVARREPETTVTMTVFRDSGEHELRATLGKPPKGANTYRSASKKATLRVLAP